MKGNNISIIQNRQDTGCETWTIKLKLKGTFTWDELSEALGHPADNDQDILKAAMSIMYTRTIHGRYPVPAPFKEGCIWDGEKWVERS